MYNAGLVLEGGGLRGIFTAGVLDFFLDNGINFSDIYGVSAGACHACSYLSGQRGRAFAVSVDYLKDKNYCSAYSFITTGDLFGEEFVYGTIPNELNRFDYDAFTNNPSNLYVTVTDCATGAAAYLHAKDLRKDMDMIRASSSMPLASRLVRINGRVCLDGGVADSIPIRRSQLSHDRNIIVLTQHDGFRKKPNSLMPVIRRKYRRYPRLVDSAQNRHIKYNETLDYIKQEERAGRVFILRPPEPVEIGRLEKNRGKMRALYNMGYAMAQKRHTEMLAYLEPV